MRQPHSHCSASLPSLSLCVAIIRQHRHILQSELSPRVSLGHSCCTDLEARRASSLCHIHLSYSPVLLFVVTSLEKLTTLDHVQCPSIHRDGPSGGWQHQCALCEQWATRLSAQLTHSGLSQSHSKWSTYRGLTRERCHQQWSLCRWWQCRWRKTYFPLLHSLLAFIFCE